MTLFDVLDRLKTIIAAMAAVLLTAALFAILSINAAAAADIPASSIRLAPGVTRAVEGYETPATTYIVANPTSIFNDHFYYGTKVTGDLKRGEHVEALAKVKGYYDWILVGKKGVGIGYVPISMLSPADLYHPLNRPPEENVPPSDRSIMESKFVTVARHIVRPESEMAMKSAIAYRFTFARWARRCVESTLREIAWD